MEPPGFDEFVAARLPALLRFASALTGSPALAEDVVQEVLFRAHGRWRRVAAADHPERYVRRMVLNEYLTLRRRKWNSSVVALTAEGLDGLLEPVPDHAATTGQRDELRRLLATLPRQQRAVLVLRYYEGLSDGEIGDLIGCAPGTVRSHASRAAATLRAALGNAREERV